MPNVAVYPPVMFSFHFYLSWVFCLLLGLFPYTLTRDYSNCSVLQRLKWSIICIWHWTCFFFVLFFLIVLIYSGMGSALRVWNITGKVNRWMPYLGRHWHSAGIKSPTFENYKSMAALFTDFYFYLRSDILGCWSRKYFNEWPILII